MAPKCKLRKSWPSIQPEGCKVRPKRRRQPAPARAVAPAPAPPRRATTDAQIQTMQIQTPAVRRITPIAMAAAPSSQPLMTIPAGLPMQNNSFRRIEAIIERRVKSNNRQPNFLKGIKTIRRMTNIFGRS